MEANQYRLCEEVLRRLRDAGVLDGMVVAGSWCVLFYQAYFGSENFTPAIRTRDLDFAITIPPRFKGRTDVVGLLDDLGFVIDFRGREGYMRLMHPDLILEFLVPERGRGSSRPFDLPQLGVNAQPLRFLDLSLTGTITVEFRGIRVCLPHPARFALHKLLVAERRQDPGKAERDRTQAVMVLEALKDAGDEDLIRDLHTSLPPKWRRTIERSLAAAPASDEIAGILEPPASMPES